VEDGLDPKHSLRLTEEGLKLRKYNVDLMRKNFSNRKIIANKDHIWGDLKVITEKYLFEYNLEKK
jgi:hypothetical protein